MKFINCHHNNYLACFLEIEKRKTLLPNYTQMSINQNIKFYIKHFLLS